MSRVYRALEKAEKEKQDKKKEETLFEILKEEPLLSREELSVENLEVGTKRWEEPSKREESLIFIASPLSSAAEQFRKLRTHILHRSPLRPRIILISSATSGEGKTMLAMNLALSISHELGKKVILVDADLRKPNIYPKSYPRGLSEYLSEEIRLPEIMMNFEGENFRIIPAGIRSGKSSELIGSRKMKELLVELREFGEDTYVLIDSSPVLLTSEPLLLAEWVDGVIFVVMAGKTPKGSVRRAIESVGRQKIIGIVFNRMNFKGPMGYYDAHYRY
jgi:protein-tyrosine kinase